METPQYSEVSLRKLVRDCVNHEHPETVRDLAQIAMAQSNIVEGDLIEVIKDMARDGSLTLQEPTRDIESPLDYLFTLTLSGWLWAIFGVTALALTTIFLIPDIFPIVIFRWLLGSMLVLFLPGYAFIQLLFPKGSEIDSLERFALDIGLSLALVPLIGLVLNFTTWGIRLVPITTSLSAFTIILAALAAARKYFDLRQQPRNS